MIKMELVQSSFGGDYVTVEVENKDGLVERSSFKNKKFKVEVKEDGQFSIDPLVD